MDFRQGGDRLLGEVVFGLCRLRSLGIIAFVGCREGAERFASGVAFGVQNACGQFTFWGHVGQESAGSVVEDAGAAFVETSVGDHPVFEFVAGEAALGGDLVHRLAGAFLQSSEFHLCSDPGDLLQRLVRCDVAQCGEALHGPLVLADPRPFPDQRGESVDEFAVSQPTGSGHQPRQFRGSTSSQPEMHKCQGEAIPTETISPIMNRHGQWMPLSGAQRPQQFFHLSDTQPMLAIDQDRWQTIGAERKVLRRR